MALSMCWLVLPTSINLRTKFFTDVLSCLFFYCCTKTPKQLGRKGLILQLSNHTPSLQGVRGRIQGRNQEAETEAEAMELCCLLACSSGFAHLAFV